MGDFSYHTSHRHSFAAQLAPGLVVFGGLNQERQWSSFRWNYAFVCHAGVLLVPSRRAQLLQTAVVLRLELPLLILRLFSARFCVACFPCFLPLFFSIPKKTSAEGVFALGDVTGRVELTPMAIAAGRRLADNLFAGMKDAKVRGFSYYRRLFFCS